MALTRLLRTFKMALMAAENLVAGVRKDPLPFPVGLG